MTVPSHESREGFMTGFSWLRATVVVIASAVLGVACGLGHQPGPREQAFDEVWQRIHDRFYDPEFNGHDWAALGHRYRDEAIMAPTDRDFFVSLNSMLFELDVSHIGVIPDDHPEWIGAPSSFAAGEVGLEIRIIDRQIAVIKRKPSLGDRAPELQPGTVITGINGRSLDDFAAEVLEPPVPAMPVTMLMTERVSRELYADPGTPVKLLVRTVDGEERETVVETVERGEPVTLIEGIPPAYLNFESTVLDGDIGYVSFSSFHPALVEQITTALVHNTGPVAD